MSINTNRILLYSKVKWIFVKDVPYTVLGAIKLENNKMKPVTRSRDTQEVPYLKGIELLKLFHSYKNLLSVLEYSEKYEKEVDNNNNKNNNNDNTSTCKDLNSKPYLLF